MKDAASKKRRTPEDATRRIPIESEREVVTVPFVPHGGNLAQIAGWADYFGFDLGLTIARQFTEYLDALEGVGDGPIDLPQGPHADHPRPPGGSVER